ncbi:MAG TPA: hypothetical protein VHD62_16900 [Opitutaceae bacterium]|nr:hypothetical protein [Opitutaceae bacterium]
MGSDELELVKEAFATNWIAPLGPQVDAFEHELAERLALGRREEGERRRTAEDGAEDGERRREGGERMSRLDAPSRFEHF